LRPQDHPEQIELASGQIEQNGLTAVPLQPGQAIKNQLGQHHHDDAPVVERALDAPRMNLAANVGKDAFKLRRYVVRGSFFGGPVSRVAWHNTRSRPLSGVLRSVFAAHALFPTWWLPCCHDWTSPRPR